MAVKIRLTRMGKKKQPSYRVVVMDSRKPRDGRYLEQIGFYDPRQDPSLIEIDNEKALRWLRNGAQPTERAQKLLEISGAWTQFKVAKGEIHTVAEAPAAPEPLLPEPVLPEPVLIVTAEEKAAAAAESAPEATDGAPATQESSAQMDEVADEDPEEVPEQPEVDA